jgi:serine/threonine protein kinase
MILEYAEGGSFNQYLDKNYESFDWLNGLKVLTNIIRGLSEIHQKQMVHCDFHTGNILFIKINTVNNSYLPYTFPLSGILENPLSSSPKIPEIPFKNYNYSACISDMGLCKKIDDIDEKSIYGVMPYVAPEVLKGKLYT